ncbi:hypothetical protein AB4086_17315 [Vibrio splendidus]
MLTPFANSNAVKKLCFVFLGVYLSFSSVFSFADELAQPAKESNIVVKESVKKISYEELESLRETLNTQQKSIQNLQENLQENLHGIDRTELTSKVESIELALDRVTEELRSNEFNKTIDPSLEKKVNSIEETVKSIANKDKYFSYADWAAIAITCVAVLLTIVGLAVAGLAFWGYKEIKDLTKTSAATEAKLVAEQTMRDMLNSVAKTELEKLINDGKLRKPLQDAIDMIIRNDSKDPERERAKELLDELDIEEELDIDEEQDTNDLNNTAHQEDVKKV